MNSDKYTIKDASSIHAEEVKSLEIEAKLSPWPLEDYISEASREDSVFKVAICSGRVAGFIIMRLITGFEKNSRADGSLETPLIEAEICNLAVANGHRRRGVARRLLEYAKKSVGVVNRGRSFAVYLEVRESNKAAVEFYKRQGFTPSGIRKSFYASPVENALVMTLSPHDFSMDGLI